MAKHESYLFQRIVATGAGAGLVGYTGWLSWLHFGDPSAPIAAIVRAGMLHFSEVCWRDGRKLLRALIFLGLGLLAVAISLSAALDRTASHKDAAVRERQTINLAGSLAKDDLTTAEAEVSATTTAEAQLCATGVGPLCRAERSKLEAARQRVEEARKRLLNAGAPIVEDSGAKRLAALLPFLSAADITLYQPVLLPVWLELGGIALLTFSLSPVHKQVRQPKARVKRKTTKRRSKPRTKKTAVVIPFARAVNDN
jgi:hypothetical protein